MSVWVEMARNFAIVFAAIGVVLGFGKSLGVYERQLQKGEKDKIKYTLGAMVVFSILLSFFMISFFSLFFHWPVGIKYIVMVCLAYILFTRPKRYIEDSLAGNSKENGAGNNRRR